MHGSVCITNGVCYVGNHAKTASVALFDLDGHRLAGGFSFRGPRGAAAAGIAVDGDRRVWVADTRARAVRAFTIFGRELARLGEPDAERIDMAERAAERDRPGRVGPAVDVAVQGVEDEQWLLVAAQGTRRHALQSFRPDGTLLESLRPLGDPDGRFRGLRGVALAGRSAYACEARTGRVPVFREGSFHYALNVPGARDGREPHAVAPLDDGRLVVAVAGEASALLLLDAAGRLLRVLAEEGEHDGGVFQPAGVAVDAGGLDASTRLAVVDQDGERVQVFTVEGRCYGAFAL
jgi:hypothetical protein